MPRAKKPPVQKTCLHCGTVFETTDTRMKYCRAACRTAAWQETNQPNETLRVQKPTEDRRNEERRAAQDWMYETIYGAKPEFRADVVMALLVFAATSQNSDHTGSKRYRDILTYPTAQRSNRFTAKDKGTAHLHYRGQPMTYPLTIASMAHHVCLFHLGISSSEFIKEIKRDGVTLADMQAVYDELIDTTKPEPLIKGCDIEEPAHGPAEVLTASHIAHAKAVLSDPLDAARQANEIGAARLALVDVSNGETDADLKADLLRVDQEVLQANEQVDAYLASQAGAIAAANARFMHLIAAE